MRLLPTWMTDYVRPWKLISLAIGVGLLLIGAEYYHAPDWDWAISLVMALATYLTAPVAARIIFKRQWKALPLALLFYWISVDGLYWLYWAIVNPDALMMREANFYASTCLYWLCGMIWLHDGTLRELLPGHGGTGK